VFGIKESFVLVKEDKQNLMNMASLKEGSIIRA